VNEHANKKRSNHNQIVRHELQMERPLRQILNMFESTQGHGKWRYSIGHIQLPISE